MRFRKFKNLTLIILPLVAFIFIANITKLCACSNMEPGILTNALKTKVPEENVDAATLQNIETAANETLVGQSIIAATQTNCGKLSWDDALPYIKVICSTSLRDLYGLRSDQISPTDYAFQVSLSTKLLLQRRLHFRLNMDNYIIQHVSVRYVRDPFWWITQYF